MAILLIQSKSWSKVKSDKFLERDRYESRASEVISSLADNEHLVDGADSIDLVIRAPYLAYESLVLSLLSSKSSVLELGAGTGPFTGMLLRTGANVCATDISPMSLEALSLRYQGVGRLVTQVADMECLPFPDVQFDMVTSAGSLSYGDNITVMNEIFRVLKPGGVFVCVDSLNHNPIYRFNRWMHFLRGERTRSTLTRMPKIPLIEQYHTKFGHVDVKFFGGFSWLAPVLVPIFNVEKVARILNRLDEVINVKKSAFKFVLVARKDL